MIPFEYDGLNIGTTNTDARGVGVGIAQKNKKRECCLPTVK